MIRKKDWSGRWYEFCGPSRFSAVGSSALTALLGFALPLPQVAGQFSLTSQLTKEDRDRMYDEIAADVAALQRQGNILKKVILLAQPTVVHIDAKKAGDGLGRKTVEEAGSGVIVDYEDKIYVLTNRHVIKHATLDNISIRLASGQTIFPNRVWADLETDIAIMAIDVARRGAC